MKKAMIILFSLFTVASILLAGFEEKVAVAFVYVLVALLCGFITTYFAIGKMDLL